MNTNTTSAAKTLRVFHADKKYNYSVWLPYSTPTSELKDADLVLFEGGADIHPAIYGDVLGEFTMPDIDRDIREVKIFKEAVKLRKPILGICRGAQLSCAMSGGKLVQHQQNKNTMHSVLTLEGMIAMNSFHHQAQYPYNLPPTDYKLLGWTYQTSEFHWDGSNKEMAHASPFAEAEIVYYRKTNSLGIQGHPEMMFPARNTYEKTFTTLNTLFNNFINNKL